MKLRSSMKEGARGVTLATIMNRSTVAGIAAMRDSEISFVSPFRYTALIWALLLGFFVFEEIPDVITISGSLIVVGTGIYTFYRERKTLK